MWVWCYGLGVASVVRGRRGQLCGCGECYVMGVALQCSGDITGAMG